jgi:hypothetical protein
LPFQWEEADLIDDQDVVGLDPAQLLLELVGVLGRFEAGDPFLAVAKATRWPRSQALSASAIARWVLPVPGGPKKQTFARFSIQAGCARCSTSGFSAEGLR